MSPRNPSLRKLRLRRWSFALLALATVVVGAAATLPVLTGRTESPRFSLEAAQRAVTEARDADAHRWAPDELGRAEAALRIAMIEHRRQEIKVVVFRNFATARAGLRLAEQKAHSAAETAARNKAEAAAAAEEALGAAEQDVETADGVASALHLDTGKRMLLQKSKILLYEGRGLQEAGDLLAAKDRALSASRHAGEIRASVAKLAARYTDPERIGTWRGWVADTVSRSRSEGGHAIVVIKEQHVLQLYNNGRLVRTYAAELGYNTVRAKLSSGDGSTPEGRYRITSKKGAGQSVYYKALLLDYPNDEDRARFARAKRSGAVPRWASPGGLIEIHGDGGRGKDWTKGCVALTNSDVDDLFARVSVGTPVTIVGSDGRGGVFTELVREHASATGAVKSR